jgi:hypothetical protein
MLKDSLLCTFKSKNCYQKAIERVNSDVIKCKRYIKFLIEQLGLLI